MIASPRPNSIRVKIRLPDGTTEEKRNPDAFICDPRIPSLLHVNHELRAESEVSNPGLYSLLQVYETQGYRHGLRRKMLFPYLRMATLFAKVFPEAGAAKSMNVEALTVRCDSGYSSDTFVKLVRLMATLKVLYVVKRTDTSEDARLLAEDLGEKLRSRAERERRGLSGPDAWRTPRIFVISPRDFQSRVKDWTVARCRETGIRM